MKKKKIILSTCLGALLVIACVGIWLGIRNSKQTVGNGNKLGVEWYHENGDEFVITTVEQLYELAKLSKYYDFKGQTIKLGADIVVNEGSTEDWEKTMPENLWSPIYGFAGTFDGQGHTISGVYGMGYFLAALESVYENAPTVETAGTGGCSYLPTGLFAYTQEDCVIKNLNMTNSIFFNDVYTGCGSIVGNGAGTLDTVYSDAVIINYRRNAGGLVGLVENGSFNLINCWYDGEIRMIGNDGRWSGGLVGNIVSKMGTTKIKHCLNTADITSEIVRTDVNSGGFVGTVSSGAKLEMEDSLTVGSLTVKRDSGVGTAVGSAVEGSMLMMKNVYTNLDGYPATIGAVGGTYKSFPLELKETCLVGTSALEWTNLDFEKYWTVVEGGTPMLREFADTVVDKTSATKAYDISWYDPSKSEYTISTIDEFYGWYILSANNDFTGKTIKLGADLVVNEGDARKWEKEAPEVVWYPIKHFAGTFDGQGHTISGVYLNTNQPGSGLFTSTGNTAVMKNFKFTNSYLANRGYNFSYFGGIVGRGEGQFDTIYCDAIISNTAVRSTGGIVGQVIGSDVVRINNCWFDGSVTIVGQIGSQAGGIAGRVERAATLKMTHCLNSGRVTSEREKGILLIGGFVGVCSDSTIEISDSLNVGEVSGPITQDVTSAISWINDNTNLTFENAYATAESCVQAFSTVKNTYTGGCLRIGEKYLTGNKAYQWTLLDFDKYWAIQKNGTPILQSFAEEIPSVAGLKKKMDISWYKMKDKEFKIDSVAKLYGFTYLSYNTDFRNKTVQITKNLEVNAGNAADWATSEPANPWFPVNNFAGTFDGKGHTLKGIYLADAQTKSGLFAITTDKSVIKNFRLENSYFKHVGDTNGQMGSIAGSLAGELNTVYSNAIIEGERLMYGGLVAAVYNNKAKISNCWYDGQINLGETGGWVGGIVGLLQSNKEVIIEHCLNTGTIGCKNKNVPSVSGLIGIIEGTKTSVRVSDSLNTGKLDCPAESAIGSFLGYMKEKNTMTIKDTYTIAEAHKYYMGPVSGEITGRCYKLESNVITGINGYRFTSLDFKNYWSAIENSTPVLKSFAGKGLSTSNVAKMIDKSWYKENKKVFELKDVQDLYGFAMLSQDTDFKGKTIKLSNSFVVNNGAAVGFEIQPPQNIWIPISTFAGVFDGQGHSIQGLYLKTGQQKGGLFSATTVDATVKNLRLENSYFEHVGSQAAALGSVIGQCEGLLDTVYSDAMIKGNSLMYGGIAGYVKQGATIRNCWYSGDMMLGEKGGWAGGIVGEIYNGSNSTIEHCLVTATISTEYEAVPSVAGICGIIEGKDTTVTITDTLSSGTVIAPTTSGVGSMLGYLNTGSDLTVKDTYVTIESHVNYLGGQKGTLTGAAHKRAMDVLTGSNGYRMTTLDFHKYWVAVENDTPILKSFTNTGMNLSGIARLIDTSWYDENQTVYELTDKEDLYGLAILSVGTDFKGKTIKLKNDIVINEGDAEAWSKFAPENPWAPINKFAGTFDGQGYSIKGLYLKAATDRGGLFAMTTKDATLKNFRIENSYFEFAGPKNAALASVAGELGGTLDSVYSNAIIKGDKLVYGGLVGTIVNKATITNCWYEGQMVLGEQGGWAGGIVGSIQKGSEASIKHCLYTGSISSEYKAVPSIGGICGIIDGKDTSVTIADTLSNGKITTPKTDGVGSLLGYLNSGSKLKIKDSYVTIESHVNYLGGQKGTLSGAAHKKATDILTGSNGYRMTTLNFEKYWAAVEDGTPVLKSFAGTTMNLEGIARLINTSWYDESKKVYELADKEDLYGLAILSVDTDFKGKTIKLKNDIVVNEGDAEVWSELAPENPWAPINKFAGTFDGQGYSIKGLYLKAATDRGGLFAMTTKDATLKNFRIENSYFEFAGPKNAALASVAGELGGTLDSVYSNAIIKGDKLVYGGLVGTIVNKATITNCWFDGQMILGEQGGWAGGIVGSIQKGSEASIKHCLYTGAISSEYKSVPSIGGICGIIDGKDTNVIIADTLSNGKITTPKTDGVGSLLGYLNSGSKLKIKDSYVTIESHVNYLGGQKGTLSGAAHKKATDILTGSNGYRMTTLNFEKYWAAVEDGTPVLKSFAGTTMNLEGIARLIDTSWYDESKKVYELADKEDLYGLAILSTDTDFKGKTVKLSNDIVINEGYAVTWSQLPPSNPWSPINKFAGTFDGQGYSITGLYLKAVTDRGGFFAMTTKDATLKNFRIGNSYFEFAGPKNAALASVAGELGGTMDSVYSNAIIKGDKLVYGGLAGTIVNGATITNCWFDGQMILGEQGGWAGGIVGSIQKGSEVSIEHCLYTGSISSEYKSVPSIGGICGIIDGKDTLVTMKDTLSNGKITAPTTDGVGSLLGYLNSGSKLKIKDSYVTIESHVNYLGGQKGTLSGAAHKIATNVITGRNGYRMTTLNFNKYWVAVEDSTPILKSFTNVSMNLSGIARLIDTSWYDENQTVYELTDKEDLYGLAILSVATDFAGKTVKLKNDIIVNEGDAKEWSEKEPENPWLPISKFAGTFDGQGYSITGLYLKAATDRGGLFSKTTGDAILKNFRIENSYFEFAGPKNAALASVAGELGGTLDGVYSNAIIKGDKLVYGGLVGTIVSDAIITNCWYDGQMILGEQGGWAGGIVGSIQKGSNVSIDHCLYMGAISSEYKSVPSIGGICGIIDGKNTIVSITDTLSNGSITAPTTDGVGSLLGYLNAGSELTLHDTYVAIESHVNYLGGQKGTLIGAAHKKATDVLVGSNGYRMTTLDFDKYWVAIEKNTPILKSFANTSMDLSGVTRLIDTSWYDENQAVYELADKEDLYGFAVLSVTTDFAGKTVKLKKDIVVNEGNAKDWSAHAPQNLWSPISKFAGTFDGQGYSIKGIYLKATTDRGGLFSKTTSDAILKNFRIENSYFEFAGPKNAALASVAGELGGTLDSVYSNAIIKGDKLVYGGLAGTIVNGATITNCWFDGQMILGETGGWAGGIVGSIQGGSKVTIDNTLSTGTLSSKYKSSPSIGGICGLITGTENDVKVKNTLCAGNIQCEATSGVGSLFGYVEKDNTLTFDNTFATPECRSVVVGGNKGTVKGIYRQIAHGNLKGIRGYQFTLLDFENDWSAVDGSVPVPKNLTQNALSTNVDKMINLAWYNEDVYKEKGYYELNSVADLYGFAYLSDENDFAGKTIKLGQDITVNVGNATLDGWVKAETDGTDYKWTPIGTGKAFAGTFDGQGYTISGVYLNTNVTSTGLFAATTEDATLMNFKLKNSYFVSSATEQLGSIVGNARGNFDTIYSDAIVVSEGCNVAGGMIGATAQSEGITITNCWFAGSVTCNVKKSYFGGLIGRVQNDTTITNCLNTGSITHNGTVQTNGAAGFVGYVLSGTLDISHSVNAGMITVAGGGHFGYFVGRADGVVNAYNSHSYNPHSGWTYVYGTDNNASKWSTCGRYQLSEVAGVNSLTQAKIGKLFTEETAKGYWSITGDGFPILATFASESDSIVQGIDTSWYKASDQEYTLMDSADLYGFALLSRTNAFQNKTIKLGADIVVNEGTPYGADGVKDTDDDWSKVAPKFGWLSIGGTNAVTSTTTPRFAGKFDGQMHTISGIYLNTSSEWNGLFVGTAEGSEIRNLSLKNSYFYSTKSGLASIVGNGIGTLDTIYSDAIVLSKGGNVTGGIVGSTSSSSGVSMNNCWFAGEVKNVETAASHFGGLIGRVYAATTMNNCLNTGYVESLASQTSGVGGLVGRHEGGTLGITNSVNAGTLTKTSSAGSYGLLVGSSANSANITASNSHSLNIVGWAFVYQTDNNASKWSTCGRYQVSEVAGKNALNQAKIGKLFTEDTSKDYWSTAENSFPVLTSFID